jgi:EAL domain-containing protein (putative c-di-GMP-specific phosphodiesterase class I)
MPDDFIPQAERSGLIGGLTEQVLNQALVEMRKWQDSGLDLRCSVNLPPSLVTDLDFPDRVADSIVERGIDPSRVALELTETATMQDPTTAMDILTRLRVKNIGLSLDDFGTGYSSLTRLYEMPFDEMKIDRSIVMNMPGSREANTIVGSLIELAHNLGLKVCTEGVESHAALDLLEVLKSDRCQGFFISRALPPAEIVSFVKHWNHKSPASAQTKRVRAVI